MASSLGYRRIKGSPACVEVDELVVVLEKEDLNTEIKNITFSQICIQYKKRFYGF